MPKTRPVPIDKSAPRYNIRLSKGRGQLIGCGWTEPYARRLAAKLAEQYGEPVVLLDCWKRRRIRGYNPSREAAARMKAAAKPQFTSGGQVARRFIQPAALVTPRFIGEPADLLPAPPATPRDFGLDSTF
jgi:hypothetical protein